MRMRYTIELDTSGVDDVALTITKALYGRFRGVAIVGVQAIGQSGPKGPFGPTGKHGSKWTQARKDLIQRNYAAGVAVDALVAECNRLPGPAVDSIGVMKCAGRLGLRRPDSPPIRLPKGPRPRP